MFSILFLITHMKLYLSDINDLESFKHFLNFSYILVQARKPTYDITKYTAI